MDLQTFAKLSGNFGQTKDNLLPKQQKTRAYSSVAKGDPKPNITLYAHRFGEQRKKWIMKYWVRSAVTLEKQKITPQDVKEYAEEYLANGSNQGDEKYVKIERHTSSYIEFSFDHDAWFRDNFISGSPRYKAPITLDFRYRKDLPRFIYTNAPIHDFTKFLKEKFQEFLSKNKRKLYHRKFKFLKNISPDLFEYRIDYQSMHIKASLKYSVVLGSLALYMYYVHGKDIEKDKAKKMKRDLSRHKDIKKLERYVKKI